MWAASVLFLTQWSTHCLQHRWNSTKFGFLQPAEAPLDLRVEWCHDQGDCYVKLQVQHLSPHLQCLDMFRLYVFRFQYRNWKASIEGKSTWKIDQTEVSALSVNCKSLSLWTTTHVWMSFISCIRSKQTQMTNSSAPAQGPPNESTSYSRTCCAKKAAENMRQLDRLWGKAPRRMCRSAKSNHETNPNFSQCHMVREESNFMIFMENIWEYWTPNHLQNRPLWS